ncbi:MAG TPA: CoA transferase [Alphaproteobacteria bacterium]|nr:CoA transferase [Alphaproteobacteria bacterium]
MEHNRFHATSSLWAGPLCGHLLRLLGARVVKVESMSRPDGARFGPARFFDLLNGGKQSVALDLSNGRGRAQLRSLLAHADIVIEASRPRALRQLGVQAEELVSEHALTWISITGYGREGEEANRIAFGDDAGASAGVSEFLIDGDGEPLFCGDAIADPLTGLHAAFAAWAHWQDGSGGLISLSLRDVTASCMALDRPASREAAAAREAEWQSVLSAHGAAADLPRAREPRTAARSLGADTNAVLSELGIAC